MKSNDRKIAVAMSGGVDSSVTALLLKKQGWDVIGITMNLWKPDSTASKSKTAHIKDAQKVAELIGIPHYVLDLKDLFYEKIVVPFCEEYLRGRTSNPCIHCNRTIKFREILKAAQEKFQAGYIATGHYVRIVNDSGRWRLRKGVDPKKDQSYFLSELTLQQLAHIITPLGDYKKLDVLKIAKENKLPVFHKGESQEICFLPDGNYAEFVVNSGLSVSKPGYIYNIDGKKLGTHKGLPHYTIGQRKNLGIALGRPQYVIKIDHRENSIVIGDNEHLFHRGVRTSNFSCFSGDIKQLQQKPLYARIRYRHKESKGIMRILYNKYIEFIYDQPQRAITPGQHLVVYDEDYVAAAGIIEQGFDVC
ncbi:tRNA 2-thiouridine(34) synthase MnmA [bacterium]|nr:tRNA 2-thiouridine(34) synthase MnmA [bacterium]